MLPKNREEALELWKNEMGEKEYAYDFSGKKIKRSDYLEKNQVGWVVTYIRPLEEGGKNNIGNVIIMHHRTFEEWNFQYPEFSIAGVNYRIHYEEKGDYHYIEEILDDNDDDDGFFI